MKLKPLAEDFQVTRDALHQVAFFALAPLRYRDEERMGLTAAPGGFGTPKFGETIARVQGEMIVLENASGVASQTITTVREAASFLGLEYEVEWFSDFHDPLEPVDPDQELEVDDGAARSLGQWFNYGFEVLERLRDQDADASPVQLWPEHFDPATELGDESKGQRASYGASPGDGANPEPYLYVAPWGEIDQTDPFWNGKGFNGASLGYADLVAADDPVETGLEFLVEGYRTVAR